MKDNDLTEYIKSELLNNGADLVGVGDLTELPPEIRYNLPIGISVAVKYPAEVIRGIAYLPTLEYKQWYGKLNGRLDMLVTFGAKTIGKSALLVTEQYGPMIRISSILTDAPLKTLKPANDSKCGGCTACTNACPGLQEKSGM